MDTEFVSYEIALELRKLDFNKPCFGWYYNSKLIIEKHLIFTDSQTYMSDGDCNAPTFSQAFRFFREKYDLFGCIDLHVGTPLHWYVRIDKISINDYVYHSEDDSKYYIRYEDAELACLMKLIEITTNINQ